MSRIQLLREDFCSPLGYPQLLTSDHHWDIHNFLCKPLGYPQLLIYNFWSPFCFNGVRSYRSYTSPMGLHANTLGQVHGPVQWSELQYWLIPEVKADLVDWGLFLWLWSQLTLGIGTLKKNIIKQYSKVMIKTVMIKNIIKQYSKVHTNKVIKQIIHQPWLESLTFGIIQKKVDAVTTPWTCRDYSWNFTLHTSHFFGCV